MLITFDLKIDFLDLQTSRLRWSKMIFQPLGVFFELDNPYMDHENLYVDLGNPYMVVENLDLNPA